MANRLLAGVLFASVTALGGTAHAQNAAVVIRPPSVDTSPRPAARPADVESVDAIIKLLDDVVSGPAGQERDWNSFRLLLVPSAGLMPTRVKPDGTTDVAVLSAGD